MSERLGRAAFVEGLQSKSGTKAKRFAASGKTLTSCELGASKKSGAFIQKIGESSAPFFWPESVCRRVKTAEETGFGRGPGFYYTAGDSECWRDPPLFGEQLQRREATVPGHDVIPKILTGHNGQPLYPARGVDASGQGLDTLRADLTAAARGERQAVKRNPLNGSYWSGGGEGDVDAFTDLLGVGGACPKVGAHNEIPRVFRSAGGPGTETRCPDFAGQAISYVSRIG